MAYSGSTAASSAANPPLLLARTMAKGANTGSTSVPVGNLTHTASVMT